MTLTADAMLSGAAASRPAGIGGLGLVVRDVSRVAAFYRDVIGLELLDRSEGGAVLGADGTPLLHLRRDAGARPDDPAAAGLFHVAFLLPSRADLGSWLNRAAEIGVALDGASDHLVSEAVYLADPEGNGIEIYADRPPEAWSWVDGEVEMESLPLDLGALAAAARGTWAGAPSGTRIGHVHLRVGSTDEADTFYAGTLGLDVANRRYPGARFFSRQGYHHHIGTNVWRSRGAGRRERDRAGLDWVELALDADAAEAVAHRFGKDFPTEVEDPWGNRIRLVRAA